MKCISCESEKVTIIGRNCWCDDCGVSWKEPVYKTSLEKAVPPGPLDNMLAQVTENISWILVAVLTVICIYLYIHGQPTPTFGGI